MCYHFKDDDTQDYIDATVIRKNLKSWIHRGFRYYRNGFDHGKVTALKQGSDCIEELEWGLIPFWVKNETQAKEHRMKTLNAKSETIFDLPSFRHCIKKKKCLIFSSGFYEWRHINTKLKIPYVIGVRSSGEERKFAPFTIGGIWDTWTNKETGEIHESCSIITTPANEMMAVIHNSKMRMPLIISDENQDKWLSSEDEDEIEALMNPFPSSRMIAHPISKRITTRGEDKDVPQTYLPQEYAEVAFNEFL